MDVNNTQIHADKRLGINSTLTIFNRVAGMWE